MISLLLKIKKEIVNNIDYESLCNMVKEEKCNLNTIKDFLDQVVVDPKVILEILIFILVTLKDEKKAKDTFSLIVNHKNTKLTGKMHSALEKVYIYQKKSDFKDLIEKRED